MITKTYEINIRCTVQELWEFHSNAKVLQLLTPPSKRIEAISQEMAVEQGAIQEMKFSIFGIPSRWVAEIVEVDAPHRFVDVAKKSPFAYWRHTHEFLPSVEEGLSILRDTLTYKPPPGPLGIVANWLYIARDLDAMFAYRHRVTKERLECKDCKE
ncbi:MAG: SRPBCC family protein [Fimbriimonadaceae bacterium]|nr:SRPBCC family protein [Fimbriimonadaceae bacterium]